MNNKRLGTAFEREACRLLSEQGWWVHFISPNESGAQPFDIIAVKDGRALAIDCKTSSRSTFSINRLEDNQVLAFEKWLACGNEMPQVWVLYNGRVHVLQYKELEKKGVMRLDC